MENKNRNELEIIEAFSSVNIPERFIKESNIKDLVNNITKTQEDLRKRTARLDNLREEKKDGNFFGNWWNDRDDKIQDAHLDLNQTIGALTKKSSQLLIINTAVSKVLNDQQHVLLKQQNILEHQTSELKNQNEKILEQQTLLGKQQKEINLANQGLLEAKGLTQEQAQKLIGCVQLVSEAENRIKSINDALITRVMHSIEQVSEKMDASFSNQDERHSVFEQKLIADFSNQSQQAKNVLDIIIGESAQLKLANQEQLSAAEGKAKQHRDILVKQLIALSTKQTQNLQAELARFESESIVFKTKIQQDFQAQIQSLSDSISNHGAALEKQQQSAKVNRIAIGFVGTIAVVSLAWQFASHFLAI